jgi:hypothetical protein
MCDYSLHAVASRPAKAGETLVTTSFYGTFTRGFAVKEEPGIAVCLLPGTELAFEHDVRYSRYSARYIPNVQPRAQAFALPVFARLNRGRRNSITMPSRFRTETWFS